jgi:hypothetical protein
LLAGSRFCYVGFGSCPSWALTNPEFPIQGTPMNNKKCPYCGFINFVNAEVCRKCETVLNPPEGTETYAEPAGYRPGYQEGHSHAAQHYALAPQKTQVPILKIAGVVMLIVIGSAVGLGIMVYTKRVKWQMLQPDGSELIFVNRARAFF